MHVNPSRYYWGDSIGGTWYIYYLLILESALRFHLFPAPNVKPPLHYYGFRCVLPER